MIGTSIPSSRLTAASRPHRGSLPATTSIALLGTAFCFLTSPCPGQELLLRESLETGIHPPSREVEFVLPAIDPSGISYDPLEDALWVADPHLDDQPGALLRAGGNVFQLALDGGQLLGTHDLTPLGVLDPTGIAPSGETDVVYITDGESRRLLRVQVAIPSVLDSLDFAAPSRLEDVATNSTNGEIAVLDAEELCIHVYSYAGGFQHLRDLDLSSLSPASGPALEPRGLGADPRNGHWYLTSQNRRSVLQLDATGNLSAEYDIVPLQPAVLAPAAVTFAPSSDPDDDPARYTLRVADPEVTVTEDPQDRRGRIDEFDLVRRFVERRRRVETGFDDTGNALPIPSIDPSAVSFHPPTGHWFVCDSEIDEVPEVWNSVGANVFELDRRLGSVLSQHDLTVHGNAEPTGIAYSAVDGHFYVTDDDRQQLQRFALTAGAFVLADEVITQDPDPEGVAVSPLDGRIYVACGSTHVVEVYRYESAFVLERIVDLTQNSDPERTPNDPEGIAFDPTNGHLLLASPPGFSVFEVDLDGRFVTRHELGALFPRSLDGQGIGFAGENPSQIRWLLADGLTDNDVDPEERDGVLDEVVIRGSQALIREAALHFDGVDDFAMGSIPSPHLTPQRITVAAWVRPDSLSRNQAIVSTKKQGGYTLGIDLRRGGSANPQKLAARCMVDGVFHNVYGSTDLQLGVWTHIALTFDGSDLRLYLDGVEDGILAAPGDLSPASSRIFLGAESGGNDPEGDHYHGTIDEVLVFGRALNPQEVATLPGLRPTPGHLLWPDLLSAWSLDRTRRSWSPDTAFGAVDLQIDGPTSVSGVPR